MPDSEVKIIRMEDILNEKSFNQENVSNHTEDRLESKPKPPVDHQIIKGKPKSGRIWKEQKTRFSSIIKTRGIRLSFQKKQKLRDDLKRVKEMSREIKARKQAEKEAKRQRRIQNLERAKENQRKSEIVQVITNTAKIKRMKKKQLRFIETRDTNNK